MLIITAMCHGLSEYHGLKVLLLHRGITFQNMSPICYHTFLADGNIQIIRNKF